MADTKIQILITARDEASKAFSKFGANLKRASIGEHLKDIHRNALIASAAVVGVGYAVGKMAKTAGKIESVRDAFHSMVSSWGYDARELIRRTQEASRGTLSEAQVMQEALKAMSLIGRDALGDLTEMFPRLAVIAKKAARVTGQDVSFMLQSIVTGIGRTSTKWLDNTGIVINAQDAYEEYAKTLGKTTKVQTVSSEEIAKHTANIEKYRRQLAIAEQRQREFTDKTKESTRMSVQNRIETLKSKIALEEAAAAKTTYVEEIETAADMLTEEQKKTAILNAWLKKAEETYKDVEVSSGGYASALEGLQAEIHDLLYGEAGIVTKLLPHLTELLRALRPMIEEYGPKLAQVIENIIEKFANLDPRIQAVIAGTVAFTPVIAAIGTVLIPVIAAVKTLIGVLVLLKEAVVAIGTIASGPIGLFLAALGAIYLAMDKLMLALTGEHFFAQLKAALELLQPKLERFISSLEKIREKIKELPGWLQKSPFSYAQERWGRRQFGGYVRPYHPYIVGERGPEVFVPTQAGRVEPGALAAAPININFYGDNNFGSEEARQALIREMLIALKREDQLSELGID